VTGTKPRKLNRERPKASFRHRLGRRRSHLGLSPNNLLPYSLRLSNLPRQTLQTNRAAGERL